MGVHWLDDHAGTSISLDEQICLNLYLTYDELTAGLHAAERRSDDTMVNLYRRALEEHAALFGPTPKPRRRHRPSWLTRKQPRSHRASTNQTKENKR